MNITDAIDIMESISGVTDESTPVGEAWNVILRYIHNPTPTPPAALSEQPVEPTDEEIMEMMPQQMRDDLAAAARALARFHQASDLKSRSVHRIILNRHAVDHARAVLARWGAPAATPLSDGGVDRLQWIADEFAQGSELKGSGYALDIQAVIKHILHPQPRDRQ